MVLLLSRVLRLLFLLESAAAVAGKLQDSSSGFSTFFKFFYLYFWGDL
jgi:hypothetical protein